MTTMVSLEFGFESIVIYTRLYLILYDVCSLSMKVLIHENVFVIKFFNITLICEFGYCLSIVWNLLSNKEHTEIRKTFSKNISVFDSQ